MGSLGGWVDVGRARDRGLVGVWFGVGRVGVVGVADVEVGLDCGVWVDGS